MKLNSLIFTFTFLNIFLIIPSNAQMINKRDLNDSIQKYPYFSIHQDNYFITGVPVNKSINNSTADAKYQISFKQMITREKLPWDTYLFLTYTQKAFWNIYKDSYPFRDINFNPTLSIGKIVFDKNDELKGIATISFDHESNGRDSIFSRSWNRISAGYITGITKKTIADLKIWLPFGYDNGNPDILEYAGIGQLNIEHEFKKNRLYFSVMMRKGLNWEAKGSIRSRIYYTPFKKNKSNQYFMIEWFLGQAESLLEYEESRSIIRIGYVIKSNEFNFFRWRR